MKFNAIQKGLCGLFSLLLVFSAAMTGTCAWRDAAQHKSNAFYGRGTTQPDTAATEPDTTVAEPDDTTTGHDETTAEPDTTTTGPTTPAPATITETTTITATTTTTTTTGRPATEPSTTIAETTTQPAAQPSTTSPATATAMPGTTGPQNPGGPKTGDTGSVWLWASITVVSAMCLRGVLLWGKKGRRGETEIGGMV